MRNLKPIVYVAGNYSNGGKLSLEERRKNQDILRYYSAIFVRNGWAVISPIENDLWAFELGLISYDECLEKDFAFINRCDAIFFCPGWQNSKGAVLEDEFVTKEAAHVYKMYHDVLSENPCDYLNVKEFRVHQEYLQGKKDTKNMLDDIDKTFKFKSYMKE